MKREPENWIQCDLCKQWYKIEQEDLEVSSLGDFVEYHCKVCVSSGASPSVHKRVSKRIRTKIDYAAMNEGAQIVLKDYHPHITKLLSTREAVDGDTFIVDGSKLTSSFVKEHNFSKPILVKESVTDSGIQVPQGLDVALVTRMVGPSEPVEVMDVLTQETLKNWTLRDWQQYYEQKSNRERIRNVISLEVSSTDLGKQIRRPGVVKQLDLLDECWPSDFKIKKRKSVAKYCLMGVENSYTDFHIDFAGTQVYYHVLKGQKTFLFYPPTDSILKFYKEWSLNIDQNSLWFPDFIKDNCKKSDQAKVKQQGFRITLNRGDLLIIPSGWIHAVYTPVDSLVIGGNFLSLLAMHKQLQIVKLEQETHVPPKFTFPDFEMAMWHVARHFSEVNEQRWSELCQHELAGLKTLCAYLSGCKKPKWVKDLRLPTKLSEKLEILCPSKT